MFMKSLFIFFALFFFSLSIITPHASHAQVVNCLENEDQDCEAANENQISIEEKNYFELKEKVRKLNLIHDNEAQSCQKLNKFLCRLSPECSWVSPPKNCERCGGHCVPARLMGSSKPSTKPSSRPSLKPSPNLTPSNTDSSRVAIVALTPAQIPTVTPVATIVFTPLSTPIPVIPPTPVVTKTPRPTPVVTKTPRPTPVVTKTPRPTPVVTKTPRPTPVVTKTPRPTPVVTKTPRPTPVVTKTPRPTPVVTKTPRPTPVVTKTPRPTPVATPSPTPTPDKLSPSGEEFVERIKRDFDQSKDCPFSFTKEERFKIQRLAEELLEARKQESADYSDLIVKNPNANNIGLACVYNKFQKKWFKTGFYLKNKKVAYLQNDNLNGNINCRELHFNSETNLWTPIQGPDCQGKYSHHEVDPLTGEIGKNSDDMLLPAGEGIYIKVSFNQRGDAFAWGVIYAPGRR